jgi:HD superfamily phosphohydrolase
MKMVRKSYYFEPVKIVRDLVHEYVNLTRFDLEIIDTVSFQRLKDVRQLTCQHVYPSARHTRFEHSLGVLELTRKAIKYLNQNGIIINNSTEISKPVLNDNLQFNAALAALLHDVGHCPFSHMGETEFDSEEVREFLLELIKKYLDNQKCDELIKLISQENAKGIGSVHEQLSCIVILENYYDILFELSKHSELSKEDIDKEDTCYLETDFELIIRCILGIEYNISNIDLFEQNKEKNVIVRLINSSIFDMDKLDYIMRDSFFTGIGTPLIDTKRLFKNMFFNDKLSLVFTSKAVPALQNMIDSRDGLYMYVYNHHAVIFSDFIYTYIARRMSHNAEDFLSIVYPEINEEGMKDELDQFQIFMLGLVPKPYLFSVGAVVEGYRSDSDWLSLINIVYTRKKDSREFLFNTLYSELKEYGIDPLQADVEKLTDKIQKALDLIDKLMNRDFLKPWWKTVFEFSNFMHQYFRDDIIRNQVGKFICDGGKFKLDAAEFRSQIAKHVIYITKKLSEVKFVGLIKPLSEGDFFVIQRSTRFFAPDTIEKLEIALKSSEITGPPIDIHYKTQEYYIKTLTNIIPQKDYSSIYAKEGFYIFSVPVSTEYDEQKRKKHYKLIEQIFAFVATKLIQDGEQAFLRNFQQPYNPRKMTIREYKNLVTKAECKSMEKIYGQFIDEFGI